MRRIPSLFLFPILLLLATACSDDDRTPLQPDATEPTGFLVLEGNFDSNSLPGSSRLEQTRVLTGPVLDVDTRLSFLRSGYDRTPLDLGDLRQLLLEAKIDGELRELGSFAVSSGYGLGRGDTLRALLDWMSVQLDAAGATGSIPFDPETSRVFFDPEAGAASIESIEVTAIRSVRRTQVTWMRPVESQATLRTVYPFYGPAVGANFLSDVWTDAPYVDPLLRSVQPYTDAFETGFVMTIEGSTSPRPRFPIEVGRTTVQDLLDWMEESLDTGGEAINEVSLRSTNGQIVIVGRLGPDTSLLEFTLAETMVGAEFVRIQMGGIREAPAVVPIVVPFDVVDGEGMTHGLSLRFDLVGERARWAWAIVPDGDGVVEDVGSGTLAFQGPTTATWQTDDGGTSFVFRPTPDADPLTIQLLLRPGGLELAARISDLRALALTDLSGLES